MGFLRTRRAAMEAFEAHVHGVDTMAAAPSDGAPSPQVPGGRRTRRLGEILMEAGLLTPEQLQQALEAQATSGRRLGDQLVTSGLLDERTLARALAEQYGLRQVDLRHEEPAAPALGLLDEAAARELLAVPLRLDGDALEVAVADPSLPGLDRVLEEAVGRRVRLRVASLSDVRHTLDRAYKATDRIDEHVRRFEERVARRQPASDAPTITVADDAPVVQIVQAILDQAVRERASDVHIEPMADRIRVRNRVDGALHEVLTLPVLIGPTLVSRIKVLAGMNIVERRRPQDGQMEVQVGEAKIDVRVATTATVHGEKCVMRLLDKRQSLFDLAELGMPASTYERYLELARAPYGMMVCAGPTGSGKTTTLYATLAKIARDEINVMTVEDPVEYSFPGINQIQINEQAGITFADGLRSILRQDPDCILVGEIRDAQTARMAVQSALTGHLVLSSIHATDAVSAMLRFVDMGIEPFLVAASILGVVGQRLVRRICPECRIPYDPPTEERAVWDAYRMPPKDTFVRGQGCTFCSGTGYQGRIGVYEVLRSDERTRELLVAGGPHAVLREAAEAAGMRPMLAQAMDLVARDVTTLAEVTRTLFVF